MRATRAVVRMAWLLARLSSVNDVTVAGTMDRGSLNKSSVRVSAKNELVWGVPVHLNQRVLHVSMANARQPFIL